MNILVPIGGWDRYFREEESAFPKPLVEIAGTTLIEHTLRCLDTVGPDRRFTFVVRDEDCRKYSLDKVLHLATEGHKTSIVRLHAPTQGSVCSCLMAVDQLLADEELVLANSDQVIREALADSIENFRARDLDVGVITFNSTHPRFSYVKSDSDGLVTETSEKRVISREAIAGFYYFRRSQDFVEGAKRVLLNATEVQGAYFISQVLNELILDGKRIGTKAIRQDSYIPLYTPRKATEYEDLLLRERAGLKAPGNPVLVVPMAGDGRRFHEADYARPKPFIDVAGKPMVVRVLENLHHTMFRTVLVARSAHLRAIPEMTGTLATTGAKLVTTDLLTEGTACTVLLARAHIDPEAPLMIANCDQIVDFDCRTFIDDCLQRGLDGSILVFRDPSKNPKWSFARTDANGLVVEVREKQPISDLATVGIYLFAKGRYFIDAAIDMIARNERVNNEFYTCPVYNHMIGAGLKVGVQEIPATAMHGIGVPEDLDAYLAQVERRTVP